MGAQEIRAFRFFPRHIARILGERLAPEGFQAQIAPALRGGPAVTEAARGLDGEGGELDLDHAGIIGSGLLAINEEAELPPLAILVQDINGVLPGIELSGVEFAQLEDLALEDPIAVAARLSNSAQPGEIVVSNSPQAQRPLASRPLLREVEPVEAKNVGRIKAWRFRKT